MKALLVEDDDVLGPALERAFARRGVPVDLVQTVDAAVHYSGDADVAVVDLALPDGSGVDAVRALALRGLRVVVLTGHGTIPATVECMRAGAVDFLTKPVSTEELLASLSRPGASGARSERLDDVERDHILGVLQAVDGNISEAALRLGLYRRTLQRKLNKLPD